ncbi:hypothetical protein M2475_002225 [Breznakia sp. PF5-3]|uniref:hypothetical protein n=1 Tax=unclassified Breznakia TaxID=2623764 RepID=UPI002404FB57|nr:MULTISPECIES: hypothetical protein [unclassified Breznakia]MDF9825839.1 hypothetical protein [Breznakia sp. PM6-1]MDF9836644.1 hypothetical protein [Breznakia sp. PF5-3]MDF9838891.1 hypothetical protein [Breznakia sp. PFB2-8]MDF9860917.1 hypothetical protein [Breznakia sp. PH5-24]
MKKKTIIGAVLVVVVVLAGILIKTQMDSNSTSKEEAQMEKMAKTYYEDYLYELLAAGKDGKALKELFSQYEKEGLKISIENISKVSEINVKKQTKEIGNTCDKKKNSITITPKAPYGKTDYKVKTVCE